MTRSQQQAPSSSSYAGNSQVAGPSSREDPRPPPQANTAEVVVERRQPLLEDNKLTSFFSLPETVKCPVAECNAKFRAEVWTCIKQSCIRHLKSLHTKPDAIYIKCVGCETTLGLRPGAHRCHRTIASGTDGTPEKYVCTTENCLRSFTTKQGLANNVREHKCRVAVEAAAVTLPRPHDRR